MRTKESDQNYIWKLHSMMMHILMSWFKESAKRRKTSFLKELVEKCRPTWSCIKQNNDHIRVVRKIRFRSSFKHALWNWVKLKHVLLLETLHWLTACNSSNNLVSVISLALIVLHLIFGLPTWPRCCNLPRKCPPVKLKLR